MSDPDVSLSRAAYEAGKLGRGGAPTLITDHNRLCEPLFQNRRIKGQGFQSFRLAYCSVRP